MNKGKFFVFEGIDGAGKSTQSNRLAMALKEKGYAVEKIDFPQYGKKSAGLVENYQTGLYGSSREVGPYRASIFYAVDRYDLGFQIKRWLAEGKIVISDRYVVSNIGHQGGKIINDTAAWEHYIDWLYDMEYRIFGIPKPDYNFILKISPELSMKMSNRIVDPEKIKKRTAYLGDASKQDIHEADKKHLEETLKSYLSVAGKFPEEFKVIECQEGDRFVPIEAVSKTVLDLVQEKLLS
ncbi:MAG: dTMP kinase [Burkholderiales bacterium]